MIQAFSKAKKVRGVVSLPGDKSISHRSVMFSAMTDGVSTIKNISHGEDVKSTIAICRQLGVDIREEDDTIIVHGVGFGGLRESKEPLDAGNSGTTARLMSGILAMQNFKSQLIGDASLSKRPMDRVTKPLGEMGAKFKTTENNTLPMTIFPSEDIKPFRHTLTVKSAQVKSALLLAALHIEEDSQVIENIPTRNHTEVMLQLPVEKKDNGETVISSSRAYYPKANNYFVPSDISSSAFFVILALLVPDSELKIEHVSLNPTRTGFLDVLIKMGADIIIENRRTTSFEEYGDVVVKSSELTNIEIEDDIIPNIIDEIPILSVAGFFAAGDFEIRNAKELRVKECDRINAVCENFRKIGSKVEESEDGFRLSSTNNISDNVIFESYHDHRIAMAFAIFAMIRGEKYKINDFDCVKISNPDFLNQIQSITQ